MVMLANVKADDGRAFFSLGEIVSESTLHFFLDGASKDHAVTCFGCSRSRVLRLVRLQSFIAVLLT